MYARNQWWRIGKTIRKLIAFGYSRTDAIAKGAGLYKSSIEKCDAAVVYHDRVLRWIQDFRSDDAVYFDYKELDDNSLALSFIDNDAHGTPLDAPKCSGNQYAGFSNLYKLPISLKMK